MKTYIFGLGLGAVILVLAYTVAIARYSCYLGGKTVVVSADVQGPVWSYGESKTSTTTPCWSYGESYVHDR